MRTLSFVLLLAAAASPLGGCAVSLFSDTSETDADDARIAKLEKRMDAVESALEAR